MNLEKLTVGQMATLNGITAQTLRYYDQKGVLKPYLVDENNGYRYYHINQSARLDMISYLQSTGATLDNIKEILNGSEQSDSLLNLLKERLEDVELEIKRAKQKRNTIKKYISNYEKYSNLNLDNSIFLEYNEKRYIYSCKTEFDYFKQGNTGYEMMMRELKNSFCKDGLPMCFFCNVGTIVREKYAKSEQLVSNEVFIFVEEPLFNNEHIEEVEENWYLCICGEQLEKETLLAKKLLHYAKRKGYSIVGDYICEVIRDFPDFARKPRKMIYKLQIPIKKA